MVGNKLERGCGVGDGADKKLSYLIHSLAFSCKYSLVCGRIKLLPNSSKKSSHFSVGSKDSAKIFSTDLLQ